MDLRSGVFLSSASPVYEQNAVGIHRISPQEDSFRNVTETDEAYIFLALTGKYAAKLLNLSDIVSPDSTVTVYEYIRQNLAQTKAQSYVQQAAQEVADELRKPEYIEEKKTGAALDKLLNWGD